MTTYYQDAAIYSEAGRTEQPPAGAVLDASGCPCWSCPVRSSCATECGAFRRYLDSPVVTGAQRRRHPCVCIECGGPFLAARAGTNWCSETCRVTSRSTRPSTAPGPTSGPNCTS